MIHSFVSTRGGAHTDFRGAALAGLAPDGGLYVPTTLEPFDAAELAELAQLPYRALAVRVLARLTRGELDNPTLTHLVDQAYQKFAVPEVVRLQPLQGGQLQFLELFHGPSLAFKDVGLQWLAVVFDYLLARSGERAIVLGATSGDTGSAAIMACGGRTNLDVVILYPEHGPSDIQRRQMTTTGMSNVHPLAIAGTFDDCQRLVKQLLLEAPPPERRWLAVNSLNWARLIAQTVYYFYAALQLGAAQHTISFVVPTGNFGNIYAGYLARRLGLPIAKLAAATNQNDAVARFINTGMANPQLVQLSLSPSMDIQVPSNLERLLWELCQQDPAATKQLMRRAGGVQISPWQLGWVRQFFTATAVDDAATLAQIRATAQSDAYQLCPHSAVGVAAAQRLARELPMPVVALGCAHPAKFPTTMGEALGQEFNLSNNINDLMNKPEVQVKLPPDFAMVSSYISTKVAHT